MGEVYSTSRLRFCFYLPAARVGYFYDLAPALRRDDVDD